MIEPNELKNIQKAYCMTISTMYFREFGNNKDKFMIIIKILSLLSMVILCITSLWIKDYNKFFYYISFLLIFLSLAIDIEVTKFECLFDYSRQQFRQADNIEHKDEIIAYSNTLERKLVRIMDIVKISLLIFPVGLIILYHII